MPKRAGAPFSLMAANFRWEITPREAKWPARCGVVWRERRRGRGPVESDRLQKWPVIDRLIERRAAQRIQRQWVSPWLAWHGVLLFLMHLGCSGKREFSRIQLGELKRDFCLIKTEHFTVKVNGKLCCHNKSTNISYNGAISFPLFQHVNQFNSSYTPMGWHTPCLID